MKPEVAQPVPEMSPPWVAHYPFGVNWQMPIPKGTVPELLDRAALRFPENPAISFLGRTTTYAALAADVNRVAAGLQGIGVKRGTKVGIFLPNTPTFIVYYFAILKAGGTVVNFNPLPCWRWRGSPPGSGSGRPTSTRTPSTRTRSRAGSPRSTRPPMAGLTSAWPAAPGWRRSASGSTTRWNICATPRRSCARCCPVRRGNAGAAYRLAPGVRLRYPLPGRVPPLLRASGGRAAPPGRRDRQQGQGRRQRQPGGGAGDPEPGRGWRSGRGPLPRRESGWSRCGHGGGPGRGRGAAPGPCRGGQVPGGGGGPRPHDRAAGRVRQKAEDLVAAGQDEAAGALIPDEVLDRFAFSGTLAHVAGQARRVLEAGAGRIDFGAPHGLATPRVSPCSGRRSCRGYADRVEIVVDDLTGPQIARFLDEHVREMLSITPPESKHALDLETLRGPGITFWSVMDGGTVVGCGALKRLDARHAEVKSMRTLAARKRSGIASMMLEHIIAEARRMGFTRLSLETGSAGFFAPARQLYEKFGFKYCEPFAGYRPDPLSCS